MPAHMMGLPVSATAPKIVYKSEDYSLLLDTDTFDRAGEDGDIPIIPLCGGDKFVGEALEGEWRKGWSANISTFTATIDSGILHMTGVAKVAGTSGWGCINGHHPIPMLDELEVTVSMEVPVDDTGITANRDIEFEFYIKQDKDETDPFGDDNYLVVYTNVSDLGLRLYIKKKVGGVLSTIASGQDYTMAGDRGVGDLEATIWRLIPNGKPGTVGATLSVYLRQSDTLANAETATEHEVTGSPFDISDLAFNVGYPCYAIWTENTTYFGTAYDSADRAASGYLRVKYPPSFRTPYDFVDANYGEGSVELWDGDPAVAASSRVYDEDHPFTNDPYLQNGLLRLHIDGGVQYGLKLYGYYGAAWGMPADQIRFYLPDDAKALEHPFLEKVVQVTTEKIIVDVKMCDDNTNDDDYFLKIRLTLTRGSRVLKMTMRETYPVQTLRVWYYDSTVIRFGYVGDDEIGDDDMATDGENSTLTDNFLVALDDAGETCLSGMFTDEKPTAAPAEFQAIDGGDLKLYDIAAGDVLTTTIWFYITPFSLVANLFEEAEDATISAAARSYLDGEGNCVDSVCENHPDRVGGIDIDGDAFGFWTNVDDCVVSQMTTYGYKMEGAESSKIVVAAVPVGAWSFDHQYPGAQNWNAEDQIGFWWYGQNTGDTLHLTLQDTGAGAHTENFTDNFTGWRWITFTKAAFTGGGVDFTLIDYIEIGCAAPASSPGETYYCDFVNAYTSNTDTLWAATLNCGVVENDGVNQSVGTFCTRITSTALGQLLATCTPAAPLAKLIKFDDLKLYLHRAGAAPASVIIRLVDSDGDYVWISQAIDGGATEYTIPLPHSDTDLQGWTEVATFRYDDFTTLVIEWTDTLGGGEIVYVDGLHEYIGLTTTRGRGETLSDGSAVVLDAQGELVEYTPTLGTDLPAGRYLVVIRAKDTDQVATDFRKYCYDDTDNEYRNQENAYADNDLTDAFAYYSMFAFISDADAAATDTSRFPNVSKRTVTENTIFVDYMLIFPIGNGKDWPQDLSHGTLRGVTPRRRLCVR